MHVMCFPKTVQTWVVLWRSLYEIWLTDDILIRDPYRGVPPAQLDEFRVAVQDLLEAGVIRESSSPYALLVVQV